MRSLSDNHYCSDRRYSVSSVNLICQAVLDRRACLGRLDKPRIGQARRARCVESWLFTVVFAFLFVDMFDTLGTLIGVADQGGFLDEKGELPRIDKAMLVDSVGTIVGSVFGTSTVTSYIESAAVAAGGRTGFTAVVVGILFILALFFQPILSVIPAAAAYPALVIVGIMMMKGVTRIKWDDYLEAIPAFLAIVTMPLTAASLMV